MEKKEEKHTLCVLRNGYAFCLLIHLMDRVFSFLRNYFERNGDDGKENTLNEYVVG